MGKETVLLTGTIQPNKKINSIGYASTSINGKERWNEYFKSLCFYITKSNFIGIVFCENSDYNIKSEWKKLESLANKHGKKIELLQFSGHHEKTIEKGYGYGEGECIDYAVDNSFLLKNAKSWYKITGRYIYSNINDILKKEKKYPILFFRRFRSFSYFSVCSAFFKTTSEFYYKTIYNAKDLVSHQQYLEKVFYILLKKEKKLGKLIILPNRSGYTFSTIKYILIFFFQKLNFRTMNTKYDHLIEKITEVFKKRKI